MASAPATVQYRLPSKGNLSDIKIPRRARGGNRFKKVERPKTATQERQEAADRVKRTRPLAALGQRVADTKHDNDMYRIGGGPVVVVGKDSRGRNKRAPVIAQDRARISFAKGPDGKIMPESKAQTLASARPVNRPFGKPSETSPAIGRRVNGRTVPNPAYGEWKKSNLSYNSALSRQQMLQPDNRVIQTITPTSQTATAKYPEPITKTYVRRGGNARPTPTREELNVLNAERPNIQVV
jgi:hypothetical protein